MQSGSFWLPPQVSTIAGDVDSLFYFILWWSVVFFIGVVAATAFFIWRYRRTHGGEYPPVVKESKFLEALWVVGPTILVVVVFYGGFRTFVDAKVTPPNPYQIQVTGQQWSWTFTYPNGVTASDTLYVPRDRPVELEMSSQNVIHSMFIPAFRVKQDVLPNRYTSLWFEATDDGVYPVFCAEYCGTNHWDMTSRVKVVSQERFDTWLEEQAEAAQDMSPVELGKQLYQNQGCAACHSLDGSDGIGPTMQGLFGSTETLDDGSTVEVDENYLRTSILEPNAQIVQGFGPQMPAFSQLNEQQVTALIEFIKTQ